MNTVITVLTIGATLLKMMPLIIAGVVIVGIYTAYKRFA